MYVIPVKHDTTYTIALECHSKIEICCGHYSYANFLDEEPIGYKKFSDLRFSKPVLYKTPKYYNGEQESNLKMFIKLPITNKNSLVILEGDYTKVTNTICTQFSRELAQQFFSYIPKYVPFIKNDVWYLNDNVKIGYDSSYILKDVICESFIDNRGSQEKVSDLTNEEFQQIKDKIYQKYTVIFDSYISCSDDLVCGDDLVVGASEGETTWTSSKIYIKDITTGNYDFQTKPQLLNISSHDKYLLANRLIEYLSENVITSDESIVNNIKKVQLVLAGNTTNKLSFNAYGIWDDEIRKWIYNYLNTTTDNRGVKLINLYNDLLCYIDKDVESELKSLQLTLKARTRIKELGGDDYAI